MNSAVEVMGPAQVRLAVEVPFEELRPALREACVEPEGGLPGLVAFGGGRLPFRAIDRNAGARVLPRAVESALLAVIATAADEHDLTPLGRADIEITDCGTARPLRFTVVVDVRPPVELPELSRIVVEVRPIVVNDHEVDAGLDELREQCATWEDVDRVSERGDLLVLDLRTRVDGTDVGEASAGGVVYEIGSARPLTGLDPAVVGYGQLLARLDQAVAGRRPGESATVGTRMVGGRFAGRHATVTATLIAVRAKRLPELDEQFAKKAGGSAGLAELRETVRERLLRAKNTQRLRALRNEALSQITAATAVPAPEGLVHDEIETRKQWMVAELGGLGTSLGEYLATADATEQQIDAEFQETTIQRVRNQIVLDAFADSEGLTVDDQEITEAIVHRAHQSGLPAQAYYSRLVRDGALDTVHTEIRRAKSLALMLRRIVVTDTDGTAVTLDDLRDDAPGAGGRARQPRAAAQADF